MSPKAGWTSVPELKKSLKKKWVRGAFLSTGEPPASPPVFPLRVPIKGPNPAEMTEKFSALREWIVELQTDLSRQPQGISLEWKQINHRQLGRNSLPAAVNFAGLDSLASFLGTGEELRRYRSLVGTIKSRAPELLHWAGFRPFELLENSEALERLLDIADWLKEHQRPGIYLRQLSLPGVDTKFIEGHKAIISRILDISLPQEAIEGDSSRKRAFEERYGFRTQPQLVRFRFLDPLQSLSGCSDLSVPAEEFACLPHAVTGGLNTVYIVENDITALSFPPRSQSIVIFGRGYHFTGLVQARWLQEKELYYWGDIDTHGFAILNQFRSGFPDAQSLLMDRETLLSHTCHWGFEPSQATGEFSNLRPEEAALVDELRDNRLGNHLRLEQEFVDFEIVKRKVGD